MARDELIDERLTESIIGAFYDVYNRLGYGFSERAYSRALMVELRHRGHEVQLEFTLDLYYRGVFIDRQRGDQLVDNRVIVEVKAAETMPKTAMRQCLSYLRASGYTVGLCLNFGAEPQVKRVVSHGAAAGRDIEVVFPVARTSDPGPEPE